MNIEALLYILPNEIKHKILKYSLQDSDVSWSADKKPLKLCIFKNLDSWCVGYYHFGFEGPDFALPVEKEEILNSLESGILTADGGIVENDLKLALEKLYSWLVDKKLVEKYEF